jgi:hypothetical protein
VAAAESSVHRSVGTVGGADHAAGEEVELKTTGRLDAFVADDLEQLETVQQRHHDVGKDQVERAPAHHEERIGSVRRRDDVIAGGGQDGDEVLSGHRSRPRPPAPRARFAPVKTARSRSRRYSVCAAGFSPTSSQRRSAKSRYCWRAESRRPCRAYSCMRLAWAPSCKGLSAKSRCAIWDRGLDALVAALVGKGVPRAHRWLAPAGAGVRRSATR